MTNNTPTNWSDSDKSLFAAICEISEKIERREAADLKSWESDPAVEFSNDDSLAGSHLDFAADTLTVRSALGHYTTPTAY